VHVFGPICKRILSHMHTPNSRRREEGVEQRPCCLFFTPEAPRRARRSARPTAITRRRQSRRITPRVACTHPHVRPFPKSTEWQCGGEAHTKRACGLASRFCAARVVATTSPRGGECTRSNLHQLPGRCVRNSGRIEKAHTQPHLGEVTCSLPWQDLCGSAHTNSMPSITRDHRCAPDPSAAHARVSTHHRNM
jgi:hypothetical protein